MTCLRVRLFHNARLHTATLILGATPGLKLDAMIWVIRGRLHVCGRTGDGSEDGNFFKWVQAKLFQVCALTSLNTAPPISRAST